MSRPFRLLALSIAVALTVTAAPVAAFADSSSDVLAGASSRTTGPQPSAGGVPAAYGPSTVTMAPLAVRSTPRARGAQRTEARPVGK